MKINRRKLAAFLLSGVLSVTVLSASVLCYAEEEALPEQEPGLVVDEIEVPAEEQAAAVEEPAAPSEEPAAPAEVEEAPAQEAEIVIEAVEPVAEEAAPETAAAEAEPAAEETQWTKQAAAESETTAETQLQEQETEAAEEETEAAEEETETELPEEIQVIETMVESSERDGVQIPAFITLPAGYDENGSYPLVIMIHGHGGNYNESGGYDPISNGLAENDILVAELDFPGCGDSTESFRLNTMSNMEADVLDVLAYVTADYAVDEERIGGFGYSMGGRIVLEMIAKEQVDFAAITLVAPVADLENLKNTFFGGEEAWEEMKAEAKDFVCVDYTTFYDPELVQELTYEWFTDLEEYPDLIEQAAEKYEGNSLVIWSSGDEDVRPDVSKAVADAFGSVELNTYTDGHSYSFYGSEDAYTVSTVNDGSVNFFVNELTDDSEKETEEDLEVGLEEDWLEDSEEIGGYVRSITKAGNLRLTIPEEVLIDEWYEYGDSVTVSIDGTDREMIYCEEDTEAEDGALLLCARKGRLYIVLNGGSFAEEYGIAEQEIAEDGTIEEYYLTDVPVIVKINMD